MNNSYSVVAGLYDFILDYRTRADVGFWVDVARESGGPVLELGCGSGRVLIPTARAGLGIVGVDLSSPMLSVCERKLQNESIDVRSRVRLVDGDMRAFDLHQKFNVVTIPFRPFQHLNEVHDQLACLQCIRRHLADNGRLVMDVFNPSLTSLIRDNLGVEEEEGEPFDLPDGRRVIHKAKIVERDLIKQVISIEFVFYITRPDGQIERQVQPFQMRYYFRFEIEHLLARAGFVVETVFGDYQRNLFSLDHSTDLVVIARKS